MSVHNIPAPRAGWASLVCLAPMCCKRARTKVGACLTPGHREWVERQAALAAPVDGYECDYIRYGVWCSTCKKGFFRGF